MTKRPSSPPDPLHRRRVLQGLSGAIGAAALGCSDADSAAPPGGAGGQGGGPGAGGAGGRGGGIGAGGAGGQGGSPPIDECAGGSGGLSSEELLAPITTVVVLCMENRSFDHYLGSLLLAEGRAVEGLTGSEWNPDPDGNHVLVHQLDDFTPQDPPHSWEASHAQWNQGQNDGFVIAHAGASQTDVMGYHVRAQLPALYALADGGALCERWYASVMGPTWPNRFYLHGATAKGTKSNVPVLGFTSVFELLDDAGISSKNYYHDVAWCSGAYFKLGGLGSIESFFADAAAGTLPAFSIIDPQFFGGGANDDHPDHDIQLGQVLMAAVYSALAQSPQWNQCLFVLTYDEHGGFFDHVAPPTKIDEDPEFTQLGFRVPSIVAGPYVRRGCAVTTPFEHVSVVKTLRTRFGIPSLNARVDATNDLSACINPAYIGNPQPPVVMPQMSVSMSALRARFARGQREVHSEIWDAAERRIPRHLDRRREGPEITRRVLEQAERLGVVRLRG
ncbi:MAG: alkaline phosphatase family protein [Polyangiaceae bacterium]|nr:alkaline phosphatase family protein [Polyangiaceae bacterium]